MNSLKNFDKTAETPSNEQNEWEKMAAEVLKSDQKNTKEIDLKKAADQIISGNLNEAVKGLITFIESGNVEGHEGFIDGNFRTMAWKYNKTIPPKEMTAYMRFVKMTEAGEDPEKPLVEKPKTTDFINPSTDSKIRVKEWHIDQEAIGAVKALSPEAVKSLMRIIEYHKEEEERLRQAKENALATQRTQTSSARPRYEGESPKPQDIAELPDQGPNANSPLFNEYPYNPGF